MKKHSFTPAAMQDMVQSPSIPDTTTVDAMTQSLLGLARWVVVGLAVLVPVFFVPGLWGSLGFQKQLLVQGGLCAVVIALSLAMLRSVQVRTVLPLALGWWAGLVLVSGVSALLSSQPSTALRGSLLEVGTTASLAIMAGMMVLPLVLQHAKKATLRVLQGLFLGGVALLVYNLVRVLVGPVWSFASFPTVTTSPIGSFNDLAVFAGLLVLLSLVALVSLPWRRWTQMLLAGVIGLALLVSAVVNFSVVWLCLAGFSLVLLLYLVARDRLFPDRSRSDPADQLTVPLLVVAVVFVVSLGFVLFRDVADTLTARFTDVSYLEVRPATAATIEIAQGVYQEQWWLGTGPNQFASAWRAHKNPLINQTIFWNTDFFSGSSWVTTMAVTTGLVGLASVLLFHVWYAWYVLRLLVRAEQRDPFWSFVALVSATGAGFLWLMTYLYMPGVTILLLAALLTGVSFAAAAALLPRSVYTVRLVSSSQRGFAVMAAAIVLICGTAGMLYSTSQQYAAQAMFNRATNTVTEASVLDARAAQAYARYPDDSFLAVRARIALQEMNQILASTEPTEAEQQAFFTVASRGLGQALAAVEQAPSQPAYHTLLALVYHNLALAGTPEALERATTSLAAAAALDPHNPVYALTAAQLATRRGDVAEAQAAATRALEQKPNFTEALHLLAQLAIAEGDVEAAIKTTERIITLEPRNPSRYYQLGVLLSASGDQAAAQAAYEVALQLDPDHANARYLRALLYLEAGDQAAALLDLQRVQQTNPDSELLQQLIANIAAGATTTIPTTASTTAVPVGEIAPQTEAGRVTSPVVPTSDLVTPLNTVSTDAAVSASTTDPAG